MINEACFTSIHGNIWKFNIPKIYFLIYSTMQYGQNYKDSCIYVF